jgi:hypothetical protein
MRVSRVVLTLILWLASAVPALAGESLFEFERFRGIPTGGLRIRGIDGGGVPWSIDRGEAKLEEDGTLKVEVEGLVITATGVNPVSQFVATLSCLNADGVTFTNITTGSVPATNTGDARIEEVLTLPDICLAPIVFVQGSNLRWFAISGF